MITNKGAKGNKGCLVAMIKGVDSERIRALLVKKIPQKLRRSVLEVSLDMAASMQQIVRKPLPKHSW